MQKWVRESEIDVYCECLKEKGNDNVNEMIESEDINAEMNVECRVVGGGYDDEYEKSLQL